MLFYYFAPLQNDSIVTSQWMQFTFGDKREVYLLDESARPVTEKESMLEGKKEHRPYNEQKREKSDSTSDVRPRSASALELLSRAASSVGVIYRSSVPTQ